MNKAIFRGVRMIQDTGRHSEGGRFIRMKCACDWTEKLAAELGFGAIPDFVRQAKLGESGLAFVSSNAALVPNGAREFQRDHTLTFGALEAYDFQFHRAKQSSGEVKLELRFMLRTAQPNIGTFISSYAETVKDGVGRLDMEYRVQTKLDLQDGESDAEVRDDNDEVILEGEAAAQHQALESKSKVATLSSAREVGAKSRPGVQ